MEISGLLFQKIELQNSSDTYLVFSIIGHSIKGSDYPAEYPYSY